MSFPLPPPAACLAALEGTRLHLALLTLRIGPGPLAMKLTPRPVLTRASAAVLERESSVRLSPFLASIPSQTHIAARLTLDLTTFGSQPASSTGLLLKTAGLKVTSVKIDPYMNIDAGTMAPTEHGTYLAFAFCSPSSLQLCAPTSKHKADF